MVLFRWINIANRQQLTRFENSEKSSFAFRFGPRWYFDTKLTSLNPNGVRPYKKHWRELKTIIMNIKYLKRIAVYSCPKKKLLYFSY